ncbi:winged helix-turn-helix domain-containing protein [Herbaspirillum sp. SJZ107]|nr:winged helix-turn-helix domain-containing protein [Herbaspirillum sp. SJZ107]
MASAFQQAGLIRYTRGHVTLLDRPGLERASCECYAVCARQIEDLLRPGP